jgi:hypothetical protein
VNDHRLLVNFARPLAVVLGGGVAQTPGLEGMLRTEIGQRIEPGIVGAIRRPGTDDYAVSRGLLIHATLVAQSRCRPKSIPA